jgi:hypothetical protein
MVALELGRAAMATAVHPVTKEAGKWCIRLVRGWRSFWWWRLGRRRTRQQFGGEELSRGNGDRDHGVAAFCACAERMGAGRRGEGGEGRSSASHSDAPPH